FNISVELRTQQKTDIVIFQFHLIDFSQESIQRAFQIPTHSLDKGYMVYGYQYQFLFPEYLVLKYPSSEISAKLFYTYRKRNIEYPAIIE
ncbi:hypothetical protein MMB10_25725, partial [Salmonella enterica]|nr:hypothetical protein [Salmonella enterica]